jgi:hypothetical protein
MAVLNSFQRIDRVLTGQPFGDGRDGAYTSTTIPSLNAKSCSGTATSTTLTADTDTSPYVVGDIIALFQVRGTGVGQWEINKIDAVGTDQYTLNKALNYTYTDSGASQAQVIKIPMYSNVAPASGTWTISAWDQDISGFFPIAANGNFSMGATLVGTGKGYNGGDSVGTADANGKQGEGSAAAGESASTSANGTGGGGGQSGATVGVGTGGGGGGHAASGSNGTTANARTPGTGGSSGGSADLVTMLFGGAGGSGGADDNNNGGTTGPGGNGGGGIIIFARNITGVSGAINNNGSNGTASAVNGYGGAGGGAGGSILIACQTAALGSSAITASAGSGSSGTGGAGNGGNGSVGRIAIHHSGTVTGTTSPTFEDVSDPSMVENVGGYFHMTM